MNEPPSQEVTRLLLDWNNGNQAALDQLMPLVHDALRQIAASYMKRERKDHTLQPTALVHEAYLRLVDQHKVAWQNRAHFFAIAASMMRRILVDHARHHARDKRPHPSQKVPLDDNLRVPGRAEIDLLALDTSLLELSKVDAQQARVVELRFFGGMTIEETAEALAISPATVKRDWNMARAWLRIQLKKGRQDA